MADLPMVDSDGLRLAKREGAKCVERFVRSGWQPIKTAPRDRVFLGYNSDDDIYAIGFWCKGRWVTPPSARTQRFSHWMPLPAPPAA